MAKNFVQEGEVVTLTAPGGGVSSGSGYIVGALFAIATADADAGEEFEGALTGVWTLPKSTPLQINEGAAVAWDNSAHDVVAPASGKYPIGVAVKAAGSSDAVCHVRLNGVATAAA
jgi:predicted RecA/RadA family phage recombinase